MLVLKYFHDILKQSVVVFFKIKYIYMCYVYTRIRHIHTYNIYILNLTSVSFKLYFSNIFHNW